MEACSYKISDDFQQTTGPYVPEDRTLHNHQCENHKSYFLYLSAKSNINMIYTTLSIPDMMFYIHGAGQGLEKYFVNFSLSLICHLFELYFTIK
jgi:hypothetical protein